MKNFLVFDDPDSCEETNEEKNSEERNELQKIMEYVGDINENFAEDVDFETSVSVNVNEDMV